MAGPGFVPKWLRRNARVAPKRTSWPDKPRNQRWIDFLRSTGGHSLPPLLWGLVAPAGGGDPRTSRCLDSLSFTSPLSPAHASSTRDTCCPSYRYLPRSPPKVPFGLQPAFDTEQLLPRS